LDVGDDRVNKEFGARGILTVQQHGERARAQLDVHPVGDRREPQRLRNRGDADVAESSSRNQPAQLRGVGGRMLTPLRTHIEAEIGEG
jgi:hypothetical protein